MPVVPQVDLSSGSVALPLGAGVTTYRDEYIRGTITSYNVTLQKLLPHSLSVQVGYVANRQNDITRNENLNYGQIGGGAASQPYRAIMGTTSAVNVRSPLGRVKYDSFQLSANRRMINGLQIDASYSYSKATDWWAGSIAIPEYWYLNKGELGGDYAAQVRAVNDLRTAVWRWKAVPEWRRRCDGDHARVAVEYLLQRHLGNAVQYQREPGFAQRAGQRAAC